MAIGDDFTIDYTNKRIWNKYAWGQGGTATVYSVNALYSWLMNTFDEQGAMDDDVPMSAQTPNAYTLINEWFIDDETDQNEAINHDPHLAKTAQCLRERG